MKQSLYICIAILALISSVANTQTLPTTWRSIEPLKTGRFLFQALSLGNDRVFVMGGLTSASYSNTTATCEIINVKTGKVSAATSMPTPRADFVALLTNNGMVVAVGGLVSSSDYAGTITSQVDLYDPANNSWKTIGNLLTPRRQHSAIFLDSERLLVVGGRREDLASLADAEIFNIRTGQSERVGDYTFNVTQPIAAYSRNGDILVFLGRDGGVGSWRDTSLFRFNTNTKSFERGSTLPEQVHIATVTKLSDERSLLIGGSLSEGDPFQLSNAISMETANAVFTKQATLPQGKVWHQTCLYDNKRVLIIGGFDSTRVATPRCYWYEWANNTVTEAPSLQNARTYFQALSVSIGDTLNIMRRKIIAIGGLTAPNSGRVLSSIEVIDEEPLVLSTPDGNSADGALYGVLSLTPNPVSIHTATIQYSIGSRTGVELRLYNAQGVEIQQLVSAEQEEGNYTLQFSTETLSSGMYMCVMKAAAKVYTVSFSVVR